MINGIQLLRNIGLFDSVGSGANLQLKRLTLVYAENGRGKTTVAGVLRSLATGDPIPIAERHPLIAQHPPQVVLDCESDHSPVVFQNAAWTRTLTNLTVFDDAFVDQKRLFRFSWKLIFEHCVNARKRVQSYRATIESLRF
jgi:wobble nucleotide-excising tRNase